jgi:hypothetical protein
MDTPGSSHMQALQTRYRGVTDTMQQLGVRIDEQRQDGMKLVLRATAPSEDAKNKVWDAIKQGHPNWQTDLVCDIRVEAHAAAPAAAANLAPGGAAGAQGQRSYTVQKGDTLSKIAQQFYGHANEYKKIFEANKNILSDPDKIQVGQKLVIP